ncbi:MAG: hypothetical protein HYV29_13490 [Ignavibacteriales bacterium]|nr:hypothetical protein [Ignavibacteriales bacterium]
MAGKLTEKVPVAKNMTSRFHILIFVFLVLLPIELLKAGGNQDSERKSLLAMKQRIINFTTADSCFANAKGRFIAFGSKPCGGPWEYLVYPASIDTLRLFKMIAEYNKTESAYNKKWGVLSDCSVPAPPDSVRCIDGKYVGYYFGILKP